MHADTKALGSFVYHHLSASLQHQTLHGTEALRDEASQNERDPFVYVDLFCDAWQQRTGHPKSCHGAVIPYLTEKALATASVALIWAEAHH